VFQFPVVYDTMTVFENLAFPLKNRGVSRTDARSRALEIAALLELTPELDRRASGLPAEMKQRISLGRGLVRKDVAAILLDEPLTVIDPHMKWLLRRKLKQIHQELNITLVYVTHDQNEALTLAEEVLVMSDGHVLQRGTPEELFERPAHTFVGYFIGSPGMNLLSCELSETGAIVEGARIRLADGVLERAKAQSGEPILGVRPELLRRAEPEADGAVRVMVTRVEDAVGHRIATARLGAQELKIKLPEDDGAQAGGDEPLWIAFPPEHTILYIGGRAVF
jgi:glycerol transport system ATP-binding protein